MAFYSQALSIQQERGDVIEIAQTLNVLAIAAVSVYDSLDEAMRLFLEAMAFWEQLDNRLAVATLWTNMGVTLVEHGRIDEGITHYQKALTIQQELNYDGATSYTIWHMAAAYQRLGDYTRTQEFLNCGYRLTVDTEIGIKRSFLLQQGYLLQAIGSFTKPAPGLKPICKVSRKIRLSSLTVIPAWQ